MAGVPYSFGYSNASAVVRQPIYSSSVWWTGMNQFPLTPSGPLVQTATATFTDLAAAGDPSTYACAVTGSGPSLAAMIPGNFGNGTAYQPSLIGMRAGVSGQVPYDPALWVADSDRGVLQFTVAPAQLGYAPPFTLTYQQYARQGFVEVQKDLQVDGNASVLGNLTVAGVTTYTGGEVYEDNLTVCGTLTVGGLSRFASAVSVSGPLTVSGALTVSSASRFANAVSVSGPLTVSGAVSVNGPLTVSGASRFTSTVDISGAGRFASAVSVSGAVSVAGVSTFTGAVSVSGGFSLSGPIALAGAGVGAAGQVLTSQGSATPTWTATAGGNFLPVSPVSVAAPTAVTISGTTLTFTTAADAVSAFRIQNTQSTKYPLVADRYGLRMSTMSGDAAVFNSISGSYMPTYFIYNGTASGASLNLPDPSSYTGISLTIKSQSTQPAALVSSKILFVGEIMPGIGASKNLGTGVIYQLFSDGTFWNTYSLQSAPL